MSYSPQALRSAASALLLAAEMLEHNEAIFKGKWKKGSKAWGGDFIARTINDGLAHISPERMTSQGHCSDEHHPRSPEAPGQTGSGSPSSNGR